MLWVHDYKTGRGRGLQVVVQGLGPVLAMLEQLQGLSRILVHHRLLHGTPEMQYLDYPKDWVKILDTYLKDLFFRGLAVAPMELMHS